MGSPWWYRKRALVFGAIYIAGFWGAALYDASMKRPDVSAAHRLHADAAVIVLLAACWALRIWGSSYLHSNTVWSPDSRNDTFVTAGPFAYSRNPLYLGNVLMALGFGMLAPALGWLAINIVNMAFVVLLIRWEERGMRERYGERFAEYCARVPQLFPRMARASQASGDPSVREGFRTEIFTGTILAGAVAIVINPMYGWYAFMLLYVLGISTQTVLARSAAAA